MNQSYQCNLQGKIKNWREESMRTMKNNIYKLNNGINKLGLITGNFLKVQKNKMKLAVSNNKGENYVDSAVKILIAVVLGGLLLAGLYKLFGEIVLPTLTNRIKDMFNYAG